MNHSLIFRNRIEAGKFLAEKLSAFSIEKPIILALPRGGVPIAAGLAERLSTSIEVIGVKKIGSPLNPEYAIGAVVEDGTYILNESVLSHYGLSERSAGLLLKNKTAEAQELAAKLREERALPDFRNKTVIVVDDGLATGMTALATIRFLRKKHAKKIIFAAPVCAPQTTKILSKECDAVVCASEPDPFRSVANGYVDFSQTTNDEAVMFLRRYRTSERSG